MRMTVVSSTKAEKRHSPFEHRNHARGKAYVALLKKGLRGSIDRVFVQREKRNNGGEIFISVETSPGDIYEIRRWWWDQGRNNFIGGNAYVGFDEANQPFVLTRDEAFDSILTPSIRQTDSGSINLIITHPERVLPTGVIFT
jgi:hypothetical protein